MNLGKPDFSLVCFPSAVRALEIFTNLVHYKDSGVKRKPIVIFLRTFSRSSYMFSRTGTDYSFFYSKTSQLLLVRCAVSLTVTGHNI